MSILVGVYSMVQPHYPQPNAIWATSFSWMIFAHHPFMESADAHLWQVKMAGTWDLATLIRDPHIFTSIPCCFFDPDQ